MNKIWLLEKSKTPNFPKKIDIYIFKKLSKIKKKTIKKSKKFQNQKHQQEKFRKMKIKYPN